MTCSRRLARRRWHRPLTGEPPRRLGSDAWPTFPSGRREANMAGKDKGGRSTKTPATKTIKEKRQSKKDKKDKKSSD